VRFADLIFPSLKLFISNSICKIKPYLPLIFMQSAVVRRAPYNKVCFFNYFSKSAKTHHFLNQPADVLPFFF